MAHKLNDIVAIRGTAYAVTQIEREGFELYAIVEFVKDGQAEILFTFFCREHAFTAFNRLIKR